jgi:hypothetical protein
MVTDESFCLLAAMEVDAPTPTIDPAPLEEAAANLIQGLKEEKANEEMLSSVDDGKAESSSPPGGCDSKSS